MSLNRLILWVTTDCNLRCRYCYARAGEQPESMQWETARQALELVARESCGSFKVKFAGGEPLLNLALIERAIAYVRRKGWHAIYDVQTNGTLIDRATAQSLRRLGIGVGVSLDGPPAVNDDLRPFPDGRGSTAATVAGIEQLRAAGVHVGLTAVARVGGDGKHRCALHWRRSVHVTKRGVSATSWKYTCQRCTAWSGTPPRPLSPKGSLETKKEQTCEWPGSGGHYMSLAVIANTPAPLSTEAMQEVAMVAA